ncbi:MAG: COG2426 family protein [Bacillota bacterium]|jgi:uncharacterized membrane protein
MKEEWLVIITAATPILELRGAIPLGVAMNLPLGKVLILSLIGNMLPVPFILIGMNYLLNWLKSLPRIHQWLVRLGNKKSKKLHEKIQHWGWLGLMVFVGIPLPGTGAWTGAFAAVFLGLKFWNSLIAIFFGVIIAGLLISGLSATLLFNF